MLRRVNLGIIAAVLALTFPASASNPTGSADQVLVIPHAGGIAKFGQVDLAQTAATKNQLAAARGGTGLDTSASTGRPKIASGTWSLANIDLASEVTGTLSFGNGGTGQTTLQAAIDSLANSGGSPTLGQGLAYNGTHWVPNYHEASVNGNEGAGTTTLTITSNPNQVTNLTAARTYTLPTTSVLAGYRMTITNTGDFPLTVNASGGQTVAVLNVGTLSLIANSAAPTLKSDWDVDRFVSKTSFSTTWTFNNSGGTSGSVTIVLQRDMNMVRMFIPGPTATSGTSSTGFVANTTVPTAFLPAAQVVFPYNSARNNGGAVGSAGAVFMNASGVLTLLRDTGSTPFTNSSSCGFQDNFVGTYYIAL